MSGPMKHCPLILSGSLEMLARQADLAADATVHLGSEDQCSNTLQHNRLNLARFPRKCQCHDMLISAAT
jgi:hypothetical protein